MESASSVVRSRVSRSSRVPRQAQIHSAAADGSVLLTGMGLWGWDRDLDEELRPVLPFLSLKEDPLAKEVGPGALFEEGRPRLQME